jgi:membrane-bound serine protease (ClpP class)
VDPLLIAFCFLALALALVLIDLIVPSAGILLVLAIISGIAADIFAFRSSTQAGLWMLIGELAAIPIGLWIFAKFWASTPMGKRMIIEPPKPIPFAWETGQSVGKIGTAVDDFLPTGRIEIDGKLFDAVGRAGPIKNGQRVLVVAEEMGQLFVVPDTTNETFPLRGNVDADGSPSLVDSMNQPAKNFGLQSLE